MNLLVPTLLFTLDAFSSASAWLTTSPSVATRVVKPSLERSMASKSAQKIASRSKWTASRGVTNDDVISEGQKETGFCTIIGNGRIGSLLAKGGESLVLKRGDSIPKDNEGTPILIATRNDSLEGIIVDCPENRLKDLVFLQNGYLDNFLRENGLSNNSQALLFFSVASMDAEPVDGITSVNPEGLTAVTGVHAEAFANRLLALNLKCNVVNNEDYRPAMFEKLIWICTYMLVGSAKECTSVGQAGADHSDIVKKLVEELKAAVTSNEGIVFPDGTMDRLAAYTDVVKDFPCAVKEFKWRNEYFYNMGDDACPLHNRLLKECKEKSLLGFNLP